MDLNGVFEAVGSYQVGKMSDEQLPVLRGQRLPRLRLCSGMFTANSMNCLCEAVGIAPGNAPSPRCAARRALPSRPAMIMHLLERASRLIF